MAGTAMAGTAVPGTDLAGTDLAGTGLPGGGAALGVVLCPPWGFEDLTMRKGWRLLAEAVAAAGYPCLRFDYPGTGDSAGRATDVTGVRQWVEAIGDAADLLGRQTSVSRFVFVGQSLGAALAVEAARSRDDVVGLQLIAPVVKGRAYVRELAATATLVADKVGIKVDLAPDEGLSVLGFALSHAMVADVRALDLTATDRLAVADAVIFDQPDRRTTADLARHLEALGVTVRLEAVELFHLMVSDATAIQSLPVAEGRVVDALKRLAAGPVAPAGRVAPPAMASVLEGPCYREEAVRFGPDGALFGVLCRPARAEPGTPAIVLLNRGLNAHIGWRRGSVDQARGLAAAGLASLRIDVAGLGESRDEPGRPVNLIYSDRLLPDIRAAVDLLAGRGHRRIALAGVCSGAYMALCAAEADPRVTDVVVVNTQRFVWNPAENVEDVIRYGLRSMNDYLGDITSGAALAKLIRSRRRIVPAMRFLARRIVRNVLAKVPLRLRSTLLRKSMASRVDRFFAALAERGTRVSLVYTAGDPGLMELRNYFGPLGRALNVPGVSVSVLPDSDHNLTTTRASVWMLDHLIALGTRPPPGAPPTRAEARVPDGRPVVEAAGP